MRNWKAIEKMNRIDRIRHVLHMFADMCAANPALPVEAKVLDKAKGVIFEANMMAITGESCKYIAEHLDAQDEQLAQLRARIAELEKQPN